MNWALEMNPHERFYGLLTDDVEVASDRLTEGLERVAEDWNIAFPDDGHHGMRMSTHFCVGGQLLRTLGFWGHPLFPQNGLDLVLYDVGLAAGLLRYCKDLRLVVRHPCFGDVEEDDDTYHIGQAKSAETLGKFKELWLDAPERLQLFDKVRAALN